VERRPVDYHTKDSATFLTDVGVTFRRVLYRTPSMTLTEAHVPGRSSEDFTFGSHSFRPTAGTSRFMLAVHQAYDAHVPLGLRPEAIWTILSQEVAQYVKDHSDEPRVAALFTRTPGEKKKLTVLWDDFLYHPTELAAMSSNPWGAGLERFRPLLAEHVPSGVMRMMTPSLSTATADTTLAHLVTFMDAASKFYSYGMMTCCGFPAFRVYGTAADWESMARALECVAEAMPDLALWSTYATAALRRIRDAAAGESVNWEEWRSFYKLGGGSGGPFSDGWVNHFYAHRHGHGQVTLKTEHDFKDSGMFTGLKLNEYPSGVSRVEAEWNYLGLEVPLELVAGVLTVADEDGYLTPNVGVMLVEKERT
jgi:hypothetical protein